MTGAGWPAITMLVTETSSGRSATCLVIRTPASPSRWAASLMTAAPAAVSWA